MKWFKCVDMKAPVVLKITKELGKPGLVEALCVVSEAIDLGVTQLDAAMVSGWASVRIDRAEKVLPYASELLAETWKNYKTSSDKSEDLRLSQDNSDYLPDNEGANPSPDRNPSSKSKNESKSKKEPPSPQGGLEFPASPAGVLVKYLHDKLVAKGLTETTLNQQWINTGVKEANQLLRTEPEGVVREAIDWFASDKRFWSEKLKYMSHIRKNWDQFQRKPKSLQEDDIFAGCINL